MLEWRFAALSTLVALLLSALLVAYLVLDMSSYAIAFYVEQRALDIGLAIAVFATVAFALRRDRFGLTWATLTSTGLYVLSSFLPMR